jgi:transcriptional regulator with XRE-family HTH domain
MSAGEVRHATLPPVNDQAIGRALRALRHRRGWRQLDLAARVAVSQQLISKVERGRIGSVSHATLRRTFATVDADAVTVIRWRGGELDRLLDEGHAGVVGSIAELLRMRGWDVFPEVTFSEFGERGSIDLLAGTPRRARSS